MPITTKEIAEMVGVSRQAVSAVLNGHPEKVSPEKRRKIFHIAKNMQYRPNAAALKLAGHAPRKFAVIDSGLFPPIKLAVLEQFSELLAENNIDIRMIPPGDKGSKLRMLHDAAADGACVAITDLKPELLDVEKFPIPLVIMGNGSEPCDISFNYEQAVRRLIDHLYHVHNHRKFALISANRDAVSCGRELCRSFEKIIPEYRLEFTADCRIPAHHKENPVDYAEMLVKKQGVTAFLCENDAIAARLIVDLKLRGLRVPEDVAVIGNGCSYVAELTPVPLTSIYLPARKYAEALCQMVKRHIDGEVFPSPRQPQLIDTGLFLGGSCGCTPAELPQLYWEAIPHSLADQELEIRESKRFEQFMKYVIF